MYIENINSPSDIKVLNAEQLNALASEIRNGLMNRLSKKGGHFGPNFGFVEATIALHYVFNSPKDKIVFDVSHQSYIHKMLTGRKSAYFDDEHFADISGYTNPEESEHDFFNVGHTSTSVSLACGLAKGRDLKGDTENIIAVIGDGSLSGGEALEGLDFASELESNFIIVVNDNDMSISENVGGMSRYLNKIRAGQKYNDFKAEVEKTILNIPVAGHDIALSVKRSKDSIKHLLVPGMFFEDMGITYIGPIDGHNIQQMVESLVSAIELQRPVVVHVKTQKGKGYRYAEKYPCYFHGIAPFDLKTGKVKQKKEKPTYTDIFGRKMLELAKADQKVIAITAAMAEGTGLKRFREMYPERFFDVGIAEQHAVTFAAGLAAAGMTPVVAVYSSFLQRAYDQILHDVCNQNLHVIFAIDRSGLVGADGSTHQGIFDISYLSEIPNMVILSPKNRYELEQAMGFAYEWEGPIALRYPKETACELWEDKKTPMEFGKSEWLRQGSELVILAVGNMVEEAELACEILEEQGIQASLINARFVKPLDEELLEELMQTHSYICTMEENVYQGGYGEAVGAYLMERQAEVTFIPIAIEDQFVEHGSIARLRQMLRLDGESVGQRLLTIMQENTQNKKRV